MRARGRTVVMFGCRSAVMVLISSKNALSARLRPFVDTLKPGAKPELLLELELAPSRENWIATCTEDRQAVRAAGTLLCTSHIFLLLLYY